MFWPVSCKTKEGIDQMCNQMAKIAFMQVQIFTDIFLFVGIRNGENGIGGVDGSRKMEEGNREYEGKEAVTDFP